MKILSIPLILFFLFFSFWLKSANSLEIVINEIAWMGTTVSPNDEWIELYNNTENSINLDGWQLVSQDETPKINLSGTIPANGFYLLERTDDSTVPEIGADKIYTGALNDSGEALKLYDASGNIVDEVGCIGGWFAGIGKPEDKTMERKNPQFTGSDANNWQTSLEPEGTPKAKNSVGPTIEFKNYPQNIFINEILPSPEGQDEKEEWIELFNQNNFGVELSDWQITDTEGKTTIYTFPKETKIEVQGFLVLYRPITSITLNNDGDGLSLIRPDGKIADFIIYKEKAKKGQSFNRIGTDFVWSNILTPGSKNIIPELKEENKPEAKLEKKPVIEESKTQLASLNLPNFKENAKFGDVFLTAFFSAIFSALIILIIRQKVRVENKG